MTSGIKFWDSSLENKTSKVDDTASTFTTFAQERRQQQQQQEPSSSPWIRGVNLGGWLVLERYIVPYQFAVTTCHTQATSAAELCWYEGALSAPKKHHHHQRCNPQQCPPALSVNLFNHSDYPVDEWHLAQAFDNRPVAEAWFNSHFENFVTRDDFRQIAAAGLTHVRIPLPHWILGNNNVMMVVPKPDNQDNAKDVQEEPWIVGDRWKALQRAVQWAREFGLQVWPNLHTAPGSQNGFDNSGYELPKYTCHEWWPYPDRVQRTLQVIDQITSRLALDDMLDVVTGFGLLNEPFGDCDMDVYTDFLDEALAIARRNMGTDTKIFVADRFASSKFNNGTWWLDGDEHSNTYLDSHIYHVFSDTVRGYDPIQHLQRVCHPEEPENTIADCCYKDAPMNTQVPASSSTGVRRISTEWSAAFDAMPGELLAYVMKSIATNGTAPDFHRQLSPQRGNFVRKFIQAQMVALEDATAVDGGNGHGVSDGWFYWTWKTEGGAFAEWDFSQGLAEGWVPHIVNPHTASAAVYGTCDEIMASTVNDTSVIYPYPWGDEPYWKHTDDDAVGTAENQFTLGAAGWSNETTKPQVGFGYVSSIALVALLGLIVIVVRRRLNMPRGLSKGGYTRVNDVEEPVKV